MGRSAVPTQGDILNGTSAPRVHRYTTTTPAGYAHPPGTGPEGETCGTCTHCRFRMNRRGSKRFHKCALMIAAWTGSRSTDIKVSSPACRSHEPGKPRPTGIVS